MLASLRNWLWPKQQRRRPKRRRRRRRRSANDIPQYMHPIAHEPAAAMGTLSRLPDDVLTTRVAGYFSRGTEEYLSLRALCASGRDVACRAIRRAEKLNCNFLPRLTLNWPDCPGPLELRDRPQHVAAIGKIFGPRCSSLIACGISRDALEAICCFVACTAGGLRGLDLEFADISEETLVDFCRRSPRLNRLVAPKCRHISDNGIRAISVACPELVSVSLCSKYTPAQVQEVLGDSPPPLPPGLRYYKYSPAETWAIRFPKLETLALNNGHVGYRPTRLRAIRAAATATNATTLDVDACHITRDVVEALVGTPFGDRLVAFGDDCEEGLNETRFEPDALIAAARGFPSLRELYIPKNHRGILGTAFYEELGRVGNLTTLSICAYQTTDACVAAVCKHSQLKTLRLDGLEFVTSGVVDGILAGRAAGTIRRFEIANCSLKEGGLPRPNPVGPEDLLDLVEGCPKLTHIECHLASPYHEFQGEEAQEIEHILDLRDPRGYLLLHY